MPLSASERSAFLGEPLEVIEQIVNDNDWDFDRPSDRELTVQVPGRWCDYSLYFAWNEDIAAMHFTYAFDLRVPSTRRAQVHELLALINEKMWLGHFGMWDDDGLPMFRHALLLRGIREASSEQMEDLVDTAIIECDRFYPAFQYVVWRGKTAPDAISASLIETVGEA